MNVRRWFKKLGIPLWAKLFVNLRASLITDLLDKYQQYFVCKWLGNTPNVADKYYRMITPEHIAVAAGQGGSKIANEIHKETRQMLLVPQIEQSWCGQVVTHAVFIFLFTLTNKSTPLSNANLIVQDTFVYG